MRYASQIPVRLFPAPPAIFSGRNTQSHFNPRISSLRNPANKWVEKDHVEKAPIWCSVDMRDGNQSLVIPMSLEEKLEYYKVLLQVGFKEIEVGFPAASETEYEFLRTLFFEITAQRILPGWQRFKTSFYKFVFL